jgi:hypothetical protein
MLLHDINSAGQERGSIWRKGRRAILRRGDSFLASQAERRTEQEQGAGDYAQGVLHGKAKASTMKITI